MCHWFFLHLNGIVYCYYPVPIPPLYVEGGTYDSFFNFLGLQIKRNHTQIHTQITRSWALNWYHGWIISEGVLRLWVSIFCRWEEYEYSGRRGGQWHINYCPKIFIPQATYGKVRIPWLLAQLYDYFGQWYISICVPSMALKCACVAGPSGEKSFPEAAPDAEWTCTDQTWDQPISRTEMPGQARQFTYGDVWDVKPLLYAMEIYVFVT